MNRIALAASLLLAAACDVPLLAFEVEAPEVCVTKVVDIDGTDIATGITGVGETPSQMGVNLTAELGTDVTLEDNLVDLPAEAEGLLDLNVRLKLVRITALAPHADALDQVQAVSFAVRVQDRPEFTPRTILAYTRDPAAASGDPIVARGDELNLAEYLYAGQLIFDYTINATIALPATPWQAEVTTCVATSGKAEASFSDIKANL